MKAKELIKVLERVPDYEVVLGRDEEGNGYGAIGTEGQSIDVALSAEMVMLYPINNEASPEDAIFQASK